MMPGITGNIPAFAAMRRLHYERLQPAPCKDYACLAILFHLLLVAPGANAQVNWQNVNAAYAPIPEGFNVYKTTDSLDGKPFLAYYAIADLKNRSLLFTTDTTYQRRLTPSAFFEKNGQPLLLVNCTFFSFASHQNLNMVMADRKLSGYNVHSFPLGGKDTFQYRHTVSSALGISRKRRADVAWVFTDSSQRYPVASQFPIGAYTDSLLKYDQRKLAAAKLPPKKWKMQTAVGGGPVLLQSGEIKISNNEEVRFGGKAVNDFHPRTLMGYTKNNQLIIMVIQGRSPGIADGATLLQEAKLMKDLGCVEALNLDGGGSSCLLINGKETITPSSNGEQRAIPAVFMIKAKWQLSGY